MNDRELLALHRDLVAIPSPSHQESRIASFALDFLRARGADAHRMGDNVYAVVGEGPTLCLNTHLDTVPASASWTRPPYEPAVEDGKVFGLGSNDAKASAAAMIAAFLRIAAQGAAGFRLLLTLAAEEETGGKGTGVLLPFLRERGIVPDAAIVGEPTGLDIAVAQKGLLVLELVASGQACHAAHARSLGASNAIRRLAHDIAAIERVDLGPEHPDLGPVTVEPTVLRGGSARNMAPAEAGCILDVRTNPQPPVEQLVARLQAAVSGEVRVLSDRLRPCEVSRDDAIVLAARSARPGAKLMGSRGVSDLVYFRDLPAIKAGPGDTARSHTPDEYVLENEVVEGAGFYERAALAWARGINAGDRT